MSGKTKEKVKGKKGIKFIPDFQVMMMLNLNVINEINIYYVLLIP